MLTNRPEFHVVDPAPCTSAPRRSRSTTRSATEQIAYLFGNAGNKVVISERQFVDKLKLANADGQVEHFVCVDGAGRRARSRWRTWRRAADPGFDFDAAWRAVEPPTTC